MTRTRVLLVGVGGQGVLTAAQVLGAAAHAAELPVVVGQLHGMSQRGGTIECAVLIGPGESSFIGPGQADVVLAFEPLEALRALPRMHPRTTVVLNTGRIVPFELVRVDKHYPSQNKVLEALAGAAGAVYVLDGPKLVAEAGADRTLNSAMLGAAAELAELPIEPATLLGAIEHRSGPRFLEANRKAFALGRDVVATHREATAQEARA